jgi:hypothetical protein
MRKISWFEPKSKQKAGIKIYCLEKKSGLDRNQSLHTRVMRVGSDIFGRPLIQKVFKK